MHGLYACEANIELVGNRRDDDELCKQARADLTAGINLPLVATGPAQGQVVPHGG